MTRAHHQLLLAPSTPAGPFDPVLSASIIAKTADWWPLDNAGVLAGDGSYWQVPVKHPRSGGLTNNELDPPHTVPNTLVTGVRGPGTYGYSVTSNGRLYLSGTMIDLSLAGPQQEWAIFGWIRIDNKAGGLQCVATWWDASGPASLGFLVRVSGGNMQIDTGGSGYVPAVAPLSSITNGDWVFYVGWREADGYLRLQVNNGTIYTSASPSSGDISPAPVLFGAIETSGGSPLVGALQDNGFARGSYLTAAERSLLYNAGQGAKWAELVLSAGP